MAFKVYNKQINFPLSGSFSGSFYGTGNFLDIHSIKSGSVTASVSPDTSSLFLIKQGDKNLFTISKNIDSYYTTIQSNLFIIKNNSNEPLLTLNTTNVQFVTNSYEPTGSSDNAGKLWFTGKNLFISLEN